MNNYSLTIGFTIASLSLFSVGLLVIIYGTYLENFVVLVIGVILICLSMIVSSFREKVFPLDLTYNY